MTRPHRPRRHRRGKNNLPICGATGKRRYRDGDDAGLALRGLRRMADRAELDGIEHRIQVIRKYACEECHGWHLTSWASADQPLAA